VDKSKPQDTTRIVAVGGSTTANDRSWAASGIDYCTVLEQLLNACDTNLSCEVLNAGADAYSTAHSLINIAFRLVEYEPDLVILMHNINDSSAIAFADGPTPDYGNKYLLPVYLNPRLQGSLSLQGFLYQSRLLCALGLPQRMAERTRVISSDNPPHEGVRLFRRNLRSIAAVCEEHGIGLLILTQPHRKEGHTRVGLDVVEMYNQAILEEAERRGELHCFDMAAQFGHGTEFLCDEFHYTPAGVRRFAQLLRPVVHEIVTSGTRQHEATP
jgi:hypothetical protein